MTTTTRIITRRGNLFITKPRPRTPESTAMAAGRERCCRIFDNTAGQYEKRNEKHKGNRRTGATHSLVYSAFRVLPNDTTAQLTGQQNRGDVEREKKVKHTKKRQLLVHRRPMGGKLGVGNRRGVEAIIEKYGKFRFRRIASLFSPFSPSFFAKFLHR